MAERPSTREVIEKYSRKLEGEINSDKTSGRFSREYLKFREETIPSFSRYEKWANNLGNIFKVKIAKRDEERVRRNLEIAHLQVTPEQAWGFALISFLAIFFITLILSVGLFLLNISFSQILLVVFLGIMASVFLFYYMSTIPNRLAQRWRLKASSQMVPAILYIVVYMRHTSNLERAIAFAAEHLEAPLSLDLRKVFYDVQIGKHSTIKESLDNYLENWRDYSIEFIESFHLIESSLYESNESQRIRTLEKALQVVLDGVYDRMLKFTHDVRSPLTNVYMLGVILPTLGLALLPLASTLLQGLIKWYHVFVIFNILIPFFVFYLTSQILAKRPGGYGETELLEKHPMYYKYKKNSYYWTALAIALPLFIIAFLPLIFHYTPLPSWIGVASDFDMEDLGLGIFGSGGFFGFDVSGSGPFGLGALLLSLFFPLGLAFMIIFVSKAKTKEMIQQRDYTRQLEREFNSSLFQIGNRLGDGIPAELVFGKIAESARGLRTEDFFRRVNYNIQAQGMSVDKAIFDKHRGALLYYPSSLIATSMKILVESVKKGLTIAAQSLMSISEYVKNIQKINERLKDLLAEIVSDMKSNMTFIAPLMAGVLVGLAAMITSILGRLQALQLSGNDLGNLSNLLNIFDVSQTIPPFYLQIAMGVYLIQIIYILTGTLVTIDSGEDPLQKTFLTGRNVLKGIGLYIVVATMSIIILAVLSGVVLGGLG
jgi:Flp pilus assembly protein TadB